MAKSKSTAMNLSSHVPTSSSSAKSPITSINLGILIALWKHESRMRGNSEPDAASSSQARVKDAYIGSLMDSHGETCRYKRGIRRMWTFPNLKLGVKKMCQGSRLILKQQRRNPMNQTASEVQNLKGQEGHTIYKCPGTIHHTEAVFSIVREICGREHDDPVNDMDVHMTMWAYF